MLYVFVETYSQFNIYTDIQYDNKASSSPYSVRQIFYTPKSEGPKHMNF